MAAAQKARWEKRRREIIKGVKKAVKKLDAAGSRDRGGVVGNHESSAATDEALFASAWPERQGRAALVSPQSQATETFNALATAMSS